MNRNLRHIESIRLSLLCLVVGACLLHVSCGGPTKLETVQSEKMRASLALARESDLPEIEFMKTLPKKDTIVLHIDGHDLMVLNAKLDEESGEMVAVEKLQAAFVTARFSNIAERRGKVDLQFQVIVPAAMQDSRWQLRFYPDMFILGDSVRLEPVVITGKDYRKGQLRGYEQYNRFLAKIITDSTRFVDLKQLEVFLERNIPEVYKFKSDSSLVSDSLFFSYFGVSDQQALDHYTNHWKKRRNARRWAMRGKMYERYVKAPIVTEGIRLDTVIQNADGDFVYNYSQAINTRPKLRKVEIVLSGDIYEQEKKLYDVPVSEPLTFYISTVSSFVDNSERYLTRVIERKAEANASYRIEFALGDAEVRTDLGDNEAQIGYVMSNLNDLLRNEVFDLDSIVVVANASPEGSWRANKQLSEQRGRAVVDYFQKYMKDLKKEIEDEAGFFIDSLGRVRKMVEVPDIRFISHSVPENWRLLDELVRKDSRLDDGQRERYFSHSEVADMDERESLMKKDDGYGFLVDSLYPRLRVVDFAFHLHRRGMVKDTVHTTELDSLYMEGIQHLRDMDYDMAVKVLGSYQDYNAAVAYMGAERNASAMLILQNLPKSPRVSYLLAILYSRNGEVEKAVQSYMEACAADRSYVFRGNLDPEISALIKMYGLNKEEDDFSE